MGLEKLLIAHERIRDKIKKLENTRLKLFLKEVITHFLKSGKVNNVVVYLFNYEFIKQKIYYFGVNQLISDYNLFLEDCKESQHFPDIQKLRNIFLQTEHLFRENDNSISSILFGYIHDDLSMNLKVLKLQIEQNTEEVWLKSINPNFKSIQGDLIKKIDLGEEFEYICSDLLIEQDLLLIAYNINCIEVRKISDFSLKCNSIKLDSSISIQNIKLIDDEHIFMVFDEGTHSSISIWNFYTKKRTAYFCGNIPIAEPQIIKSKHQLITKSIFRTGEVILWDLISITFTTILSVECEINKMELLTRENQLYPLLSVSFDIQLLVIYRLVGCNARPISSIEAKEYINIDSKTFNPVYESVVFWDDSEFVLIDLMTTKVKKQVSIEMDNCEILNVIPTYNENIFFIIEKQHIMIYDYGENSFSFLYDYSRTFDYKIINKINSDIVFVNLNDKLFELNLKTQKLDHIYHNWVVDRSKYYINKNSLLSILNNKIELWTLRKESLNAINHLGFTNFIKTNNSINGLISGSQDRMVKIFVTSNNSEIEIQNFEGHNYSVTDADSYVKKNETFLVSVGGEDLLENESELIQWNLTKNKIRQRIKMSNTAHSVRVFNNGKTVFTFDEEYSIKLWNLRWGIKIKEIKHQTIDDEYHNRISDANNQFKEVLKGNETFAISPSLLYPFPKVVFDSLNKYAIIGYFDGRITVFSFKRRRIFMQKNIVKKSITSLFTENDYIIAGSIAGQIDIFNIRTKELLNSVHVHTKSVTKVQFIKIYSRDEDDLKPIISSSENKLVIHNIANVIFELKRNIVDFEWLSDLKLLIIVVEETNIEIWDILKVERLFKMNIGRPIRRILYSKERKQIIVSEINGQIHFLQLQNESN